MIIMMTASYRDNGDDHHGGDYDDQHADDDDYNADDDGSPDEDKAAAHAKSSLDEVCRLLKEVGDWRRGQVLNIQFHFLLYLLSFFCCFGVKLRHVISCNWQVGTAHWAGPKHLIFLSRFLLIAAVKTCNHLRITLQTKPL